MSPLARMQKKFAQREKTTSKTLRIAAEGFIQTNQLTNCPVALGSVDDTIELLGV